MTQKSRRLCVGFFLMLKGWVLRVRRCVGRSVRAGD